MERVINVLTTFILLFSVSVLTQENCAEWTTYSTFFGSECDTFADVITIDQTMVDQFLLDYEGNVVSFAGLTSVGGVVFDTVDVKGLSFDFPDLLNFEEIENVGFELVFVDTSIDDVFFPALEKVYGIRVVNTEIIGEGLVLPMLAECIGDFQINDSVFNIEMPLLESIVGKLAISGNSFPGGIELPSLTTVGESFEIYGNDISQLGRFESLMSIGTEYPFVLSNNQGFTELVGAFNALEFTGNLEIQENHDLQNIELSFNAVPSTVDTSEKILSIENNSALENITNSFGCYEELDLFIIDNPSLAIFKGNLIELIILVTTPSIDIIRPIPNRLSFLNCESLRILTNFLVSVIKINDDLTFQNCPNQLKVNMFLPSLGSHKNTKILFSNFSADVMSNILDGFTGTTNVNVIFDIDVFNYTSVLEKFAPTDAMRVIINTNGFIEGSLYFKASSIMLLDRVLNTLVNSDEGVLIRADYLVGIVNSFQNLATFNKIILDTPSLKKISKSFIKVQNVNQFYITSTPHTAQNKDIWVHCGSLETITDSFSEIVAINDFILLGCPMIRAIDRIAPDATVMESIQIEENDILFGMGDSFKNIRTIGDLVLKNNPSFRTVPDFQNLLYLDTLSLIKSKLDRLYLLNVVNINSEVKIQDNELLDMIVRTSPQAIPVGSLYLVNNPRLRGMPFQISEQTEPIVFGNNLLCNNIVQHPSIQCCGDNETHSLNNEFCDAGNDYERCNANCNECGIKYFGINCLQQCSCESGFCDYGLTGGGGCVSCYTGHFGKNCQSECTCFRGTCKDGLDGDGTCSICFTNYYGINCENYCFCGEGDCDYETGVCLQCNDGYFGTNCHVKKKVNRKVFPIINCITPSMETNEYIAYLGYANTDSDSVPGTDVESKLLCGGDETQIDIPIDSFLPGQHNFIRRVTCYGNLIWELNLTSVTILDTDLEEYYCGRMDQKFVIPITQKSDENDREEIRHLIIEQLDITNVSINEILRNSTTKRTISHELLITFSVGNDTADGTAAEAIYQYASGNAAPNLNTLDIIENTEFVYLTFNETVGLNEEEIRQLDVSQQSNQGLVTAVVIVAVVAVFLSTVISLFVGVPQIRNFFCRFDQ